MRKTILIMYIWGPHKNIRPTDNQAIEVYMSFLAKETGLGV